MRSNQVLFSNQDASAVSSVSSIVVVWREASRGFQPGGSLCNTGGLYPQLLGFKENRPKTYVFQKPLGIAYLPYLPFPHQRAL